jgi:hypothetical protein
MCVTKQLAPPGERFAVQQLRLAQLALRLQQRGQRGSRTQRLFMVIPELRAQAPPKRVCLGRKPRTQAAVDLGIDGLEAAAAAAHRVRDHRLVALLERLRTPRVDLACAHQDAVKVRELSRCASQ